MLKGNPKWKTCQSNVYKLKVWRYKEMPCFLFAEKCAAGQKENWQFVEIGRHGQFNVSWNWKGIEHLICWGNVSGNFFLFLFSLREPWRICFLSKLRKLHPKLETFLVTLIGSKCWMCSFFWNGTNCNFCGKPNLGVRVAWIWFLSF